jgi:hypothetical protein
MTMRRIVLFTFIILGIFFTSCQQDEGEISDIDQLLAGYMTVDLTTDLAVLTVKERQMIPVLIEAADIMNELFWMQAYGDKASLLDAIDDPRVREYVRINYGPWDRVRGNESFVEGYGEKPLGANFYPPDITVEEFKAALLAAPDGGEQLRDLYTMIRRDDDGGLIAVPYHVAFGEKLRRAAELLRQASELAEDAGLRRYLRLRADAIETDIYQPSDMAWLDMKDNTVDLVIGAIETYEDRLFGYKAAFEAFVLVKDKEWSGRLDRYAAMLPELQRGLPVPEAYKQEEPGMDSDLNAYDAIYYAGDCNAGSKTIAINLPNDEEVQLAKGTRRLQLKNSMQAKFDNILIPITDLLIDPAQRNHITFDAFFNNVMFHEVAHGLGIKNTITGRGTVREALREQSSAVEEGKADILGLYMVTELHNQGEFGNADLMDNYVTFLGSIFRSIRFGTSSAHGRANLMQFNFFREMGAFTRDERSGTYHVDFERMQEAITALAEKILRLQGDGDYDATAEFMTSMGRMDPHLDNDLKRLAQEGIPIDIVFNQGLDVLGLE